MWCVVYLNVGIGHQFTEMDVRRKHEEVGVKKRKRKGYLCSSSGGGGNGASQNQSRKLSECE